MNGKYIEGEWKICERRKDVWKMNGSWLEVNGRCDEAVRNLNMLMQLT